MKQVQLVLLKRLDRPGSLPIIRSIKAVLSRIGRRSRISRYLEPA